MKTVKTNPPLWNVLSDNQQATINGGNPAPRPPIGGGGSSGG